MLSCVFSVGWLGFYKEDLGPGFASRSGLKIWVWTAKGGVGYRVAILSRLV